MVSISHMLHGAGIFTYMTEEHQWKVQAADVTPTGGKVGLDDIAIVHILAFETCLAGQSTKMT